MKPRSARYTLAITALLALCQSLSAATSTVSANFSLGHGVSVSTGSTAILGSSSNSASTSTSVSVPQFAAANGTLNSVNIAIGTNASTTGVAKTGLLSLLSGGTLGSTLKATVSSGSVSRQSQDSVSVNGSTLLGLLGGSGSTAGAAVNASITISDPTELAAFVGSGSVGANIVADDNVVINTLASLLSGVGLNSSGTYAGHVDVTYNYTPLAIVSAPGIGSQPSALNLSTGGTITLSVTATGTGPFTYQWSKNGGALSGATASTLTINNASLADSGAYTVTVTNSGGSTTSSPAAVVVAALPSNGAAPTISSQPTAVTVSFGGTITLSVGATGTGPFTYQWNKNGVAISGATASTLTINSASLGDSGSYNVVVTNAGGSTTSSSAAVVVLAAPTTNTAPSIGGSGPVSQSVPVGSPVTFSISVTGTAPFSYQWRKDGNAIAGATNANLTISAVQSSDVGAYSVTVTNPFGSVTSVSAQLTISGTGSTGGGNGVTVPTISTGPASQTVSVGANVSFSIVVTGQGTLTYQWLKNGVALLGATSTTYSLTNVQPSDAADYSIIVQNALGAVVSAPATLTVNGIATKAVAAAARLVNLSTRSMIGSGADVLIGGFVIGGNTDQAFLIRGVGPSLQQLGINGTLPDPKITIYKGDKVVVTSQDWSNAADRETIKTWTQATGAFPLLANSRDDALMATLSPGAYTVVMEGINGDTGQGLIEFYNLSTGQNTALGSDIVNLSSRGRVTKDHPVIAGFVVGGSSPKPMMIRGVGPSLATLGVTGFLKNPHITLYRGSDVVKENGDWDTGNDPAAIRRVSQTVGAFPLDPSSKDAVLLISLDPGTYTAVISGDDDSEGVALVEIYQASF